MLKSCLDSKKVTEPKKKVKIKELKNEIREAMAS
jgi:hypothetical protein